MKLTLFTGDKRFERLADIMTQNGFEVIKNDVRGIAKSRAVILPFPMNTAAVATGKYPYLQSILDSDICGKIIFSGLTDDMLRRAFESRGAKTFDYMADEVLCCDNAAFTAEGAVAEAVMSSERSLCGSHCLITGYGRIGRRLALALRALGADVTVAIRRETLFGEIEAAGLYTCNINNIPPLSEFDYIFNTVPKKIINAQQTKQIRSDCLLIELASAPGGFDKVAAENQGIQLINAQGMPGKYAPASAAQTIYRVIADKLKEE